VKYALLGYVRGIAEEKLLNKDVRSMLNKSYSKSRSSELLIDEYEGHNLKLKSLAYRDTSCTRH
jgi:hypothetical protein